MCQNCKKFKILHRTFNSFNITQEQIDRSPDSKRRNTIHSRSGSRNRRSASHRKRSRSLSSSQSFKIDWPSVPREPVRTFDKRASVSPLSRRYAANSSNNFLKEARRGLKSSSLTATPGATPSTKSVSNLSSSHMAKRYITMLLLTFQFIVFI